MGIEDIQISEELETNAPSIKYRGDEGPRSPQQEQQMMMAQLEEAYSQYVDEMIEMGQEDSIMPLRQFIEQAMAEGQMSGGNPLPQDPTKPVNPFQPKPTGPVLPNRQMAAYGGIMGLDGRRKYGIGSSLKKRFRKLIPNEVAKVAEVAAPFVAPFNPLLAGAMSAVGGFDRTGRIGSSLKSGLKNYAVGQLMRGVGGGTENLQGMSFKVPGGSASGFGQYFSSPIQDTGGIGKMFQDTFSTSGSIDDPNRYNVLKEDQFLADRLADSGKEIVKEQAKKFSLSDLPGLVKKNLQAAGLGNNLMTGLLVGGLGTAALTGNMTEEEIQDTNRGEGLDVEAIRTEVLTAMKDPTGEALKALRVKYPFLGRRDTKDLSAMAMGGRIGYGLGNLVGKSVSASMNEGDIPSSGEASGMGGMIVDLIKRNPQMFKQDISGGLQKNNLFSQNTGMGGMFSKIFDNPRMYNQLLRNKTDFIDENFNDIDDREEEFMSNRISRAEGGIMDLGGMEKDYRNTGGFVDLGAKERADDVPARLSVNEFVFTADAVRNAGGGDIDRGAEVMENMMKHLEQGGQVSEESQGMAGAQQMFETSQRLSEVI